jgi:cobalt/nickel transport system permease protein
MANIVEPLYNIRLLDDLAQGESLIHQLHPLVKIVTTMIYLVIVLSFGRYEVIPLLPFIFYPVIIIALAELPLGPIMKRVLILQPLVIGIGILNPVFDQQSIVIGGITLARGWITFLSILLKSILTITISLLLIATTGMDRLAAAMRSLKVPKILVLQILLTYRYISLLIEELARMVRAYSLRAPGQKGIEFKAWGSFAGQLLLRTYDRAQRVYESMVLRGFNGDYNPGNITAIYSRDIVYLAGWILFFVTARVYNLPVLLGIWLSGVVF